MNLTLEEKQKVTRLIEEGIVRSTDRLGKMSKTEWAVMSSSTNEVPAVRMLSWFQRSKDEHVAVHFRSGEGVPLDFLIIFSEKSAQSVTGAVTRPYSAKLDGFSNLMELTIGEVSNIVAQSVIGAMADEFEKTIILSIPEVHRGPKASLLGVVLEAYDGREDVLLMSHVEMFSEDLSADCAMVIIVNAEVLHGLVRSRLAD
jgi:chemotaxis protein CheY-P-specific phosphatase CheC